MGVLNTTPDSFFDGGRYLTPNDARTRVDELLAAGADIIDIGSESTRPGAEAVAAAEQIARAEAALGHAIERGAYVSIDTTSPDVARYALSRGAHIVNDVSCLADGGLAEVARDYDAILLMMHSRGSMRRMPGFSNYPESGYGDVVVDVAREWRASSERALDRGLSADRLWFDPGLGFHKSAVQSAALLKRLEEFAGLGALLAVGPSRKSFIGALDRSEPTDRLGGTIAACLRAVDAGARVLRVHDVQAVRQALLARRAFARPLETGHA